MNLRRTDVDWDPTLIRIEYLDDKGQPYYCSFGKNDSAAPEVPPEGTPGRGAENFPTETTVLAGGANVATRRQQPAT